MTILYFAAYLFLLFSASYFSYKRGFEDGCHGMREAIKRALRSMNKDLKAVDGKLKSAAEYAKERVAQCEEKNSTK